VKQKSLAAIITSVAVGVGASGNAVATQVDRYSGMECDGYTHDPHTPADRYKCPILNWFPDGANDISTVFVQLTIPENAVDYMTCNNSIYDVRPRARICTVFSSVTGTAFGSNCSIWHLVDATATVGATVIDLENELSAITSSFPFGGLYIDVDTGPDVFPCNYLDKAVFRGYQVVSP
jgi:hypothetical protein